ncbi:hypothetical protein DPEC_G00327300 [Dallia pectoralis]|uniref:Uncharacterized protein n=1 Tax=Dallia pectoralis TaxID=75939 RepID=A0ACC2F8B8_DALPE|nr:hypothetical protein DPEC_G00327300 [Dallia pectoralis]
MDEIVSRRRRHGCPGGQLPVQTCSNSHVATQNQVTTSGLTCSDWADRDLASTMSQTAEQRAPSIPTLPGGLCSCNMTCSFERRNVPACIAYLLN